MENRLSFFSNLLGVLRTHGLVETCRRIFEKYISHIVKKDHIRLFRVAAGRRLVRILGSETVKYGAFKGLNLENFVTWGASDRASQLLGIYEQEVVNLIAQLAGPQKTFVDVGAAEGYFAAGVLVNNLFGRVVCFEAQEESRHALAKTLSSNGVAKRATIFGAAGSDFVRIVGQELSFDFGNAVILMDIEGGETHLLTQGNLKDLSRATIVVEMHPIQVAETEIRKLEILCALTHQVDELVTGERNPGAFPELVDFTDDERWLICSEGRYRRGRWLVLRPKI